jgi:hypothetical protein
MIPAEFKRRKRSLRENLSSSPALRPGFNVREREG